MSIAKQLLWLLGLGTGVAWPQSFDGLWDAVVVVNGYEVPFRIEFAQRGKQVQGSFLDGDVKVTSTSGDIQDESLHLRYDFFNADLRATFRDGHLTGAYDRRTSKGVESYPFRAHRFMPATQSTVPGPSLAGEWILNTNVTGRPNVWRLWLRQSGTEVAGVILRLDGDTGTLSGKFQDGRLAMSHFSGARPSLVEARLTPDGTLEGTVNRSVKFVGTRAAEAHQKGLPEPADPSRFTSVRDPGEPFHFSFPDLEGRNVSNTDERFRGKVVIATIMGSWCPNCQDEAPLLVELYNKYQGQGLEVVGLSFEAFQDPQQVRQRVLAFIRRHDVTYPILIAGLVEQGAVQQKLPQIVNFDSYPTTFFLGRDGRVKSVHAGFAGPATAEEHLRVKREFEDLVQRLLNEKPPTTSAAIVNRRCCAGATGRPD